MSYLKKKYSLSKLTESLRSLTTSGGSTSSYAEPISDGEDDDLFKREQKTRAKFPVSIDLSEYDVHPSSTSLDFAGAGLRSESFVGMEFWIYTIGFYAELGNVKKCLKNFESADPETVHENDSFSKAIIGMKGVTRVLRFVITLAGLTAGIVVSQFDKVLLPKMKAKGKEESYKFITNNIGKAKLKKGTVMYLTLSADGTVSCICDDEMLGNVKCDTLCESIMEIYFGEKPISEDVKEKICKGLHGLLKA